MGSLLTIGGMNLTSKFPSISNNKTKEKSTLVMIASEEIPMEEENSTSIKQLINCWSIRINYLLHFLHLVILTKKEENLVEPSISSWKMDYIRESKIWFNPFSQNIGRKVKKDMILEDGKDKVNGRSHLLEDVKDHSL